MALSVRALLAAMLLVPTAAAGDERFYATTSGLFVVSADSVLSAESETVKATTILEMDRSLGLLVAVGYGAAGGLRTELEFGLRRADFDSLGGVGVVTPSIELSVESEVPFRGDASTFSAMLTAVYVLEAERVRPYPGIGIGLALHDIFLDAQTIKVGPEAIEIKQITGDVVAVAYQVLVGIAYSVSERIELRAGYRYFTAGESEFDELRARYTTRNLEAGILFRF